jgi:hypothetical protein
MKTSPKLPLALLLGLLFSTGDAYAENRAQFDRPDPKADVHAEEGAAATAALGAGTVGLAKGAIDDFQDSGVEDFGRAQARRERDLAAKSLQILTETRNPDGTLNEVAFAEWTERLSRESNALKEQMKKLVPTPGSTEQAISDQRKRLFYRAFLEDFQLARLENSRELLPAQVPAEISKYVSEIGSLDERIAGHLVRSEVKASRFLMKSTLGGVSLLGTGAAFAYTLHKLNKALNSGLEPMDSAVAGEGRPVKLERAPAFLVGPHDTPVGEHLLAQPAQ